jgi:hypothetical protein
MAERAGLIPVIPIFQGACARAFTDFKLTAIAVRIFRPTGSAEFRRIPPDSASFRGSLSFTADSVLEFQPIPRS